MRGSKGYHCPTCKKPLQRKPIQYGLPDPDSDRSDVIPGGCCVDDGSPKFGYECPKCHKAFVVKQGQLLPLNEDETEENDEDSKADDDEEGEDENKKIDDDIQDLEMLDFFENG